MSGKSSPSTGFSHALVVLWMMPKKEREQSTDTHIAHLTKSHSMRVMNIAAQQRPVMM